MVTRGQILLIICLLLIFFGPTIAKEFYSFPQINTVEDRDLYLLRRPAAYGYDNNTGTRNISGASLKSSLFPNMTGYARKGEAANFTTVTANAVLLSSWLTVEEDITSTSGGLFANRLGDTTGTWAYISDLVNHRLDLFNPHQVVPSQIFGNHTGSRYPVFAADNSYTWQRPLEACVNIFDGKNATCTVGTTTTGAAGTSAVVTNSGTIADAVFNFTIPRGDTGTAGANGAAGAAATIAVGTVSTGIAGSSAIITNTGTSSAASFDFTIPRGDTGDAGSPDTPTQIRDKIATQEDGAILTMRQGATEAATVAKVSIKDAAGNTRQYSDGAGYQFFKDVNGYNRVTVDSAGTISVRDAANKLRLTINTNGEYIAYRGNGTTIAFAHYSTRMVL